jgi:hypothetical protein
MVVMVNSREGAGQGRVGSVNRRFYATTPDRQLMPAKIPCDDLLGKGMAQILQDDSGKGAARPAGVAGKRSAAMVLSSVNGTCAALA